MNEGKPLSRMMRTVVSSNHNTRLPKTGPNAPEQPGSETVNKEKGVDTRGKIRKWVVD
jgi:hypothetical protein